MHPLCICRLCPVLGLTQSAFLQRPEVPGMAPTRTAVQDRLTARPGALPPRAPPTERERQCGAGWQLGRGPCLPTHHPPNGNGGAGQARLAVAREENGNGSARPKAIVYADRREKTSKGRLMTANRSVAGFVAAWSVGGLLLVYSITSIHLYIISKREIPQSPVTVSNLPILTRVCATSRPEAVLKAP